ncbi:hypothetical protein JCM8202_001365 [Rhodotorula sphaerocarpa]
MDPQTESDGDLPGRGGSASTLTLGDHAKEASGLSKDVKGLNANLGNLQKFLASASRSGGPSHQDLHEQVEAIKEHAEEVARRAKEHAQQLVDHVRENMPEQQGRLGGFLASPSGPASTPQMITAHSMGRSRSGYGSASYARSVRDF